MSGPKGERQHEPAHRRRPLRLRLATAAASLALLAAAAAGVHACRSRAAGPPAVITAPVAVADLEDAVLATGTLEAARLVSVGAQVSGQIKSLKVALGDTVAKGQLVAEIDSLPQQNALRNRGRRWPWSEAQKQAKEASLHQAELNFKRPEQLLPRRSRPARGYETAEAEPGHHPPTSPLSTPRSSRPKSPSTPPSSIWATPGSLAHRRRGGGDRHQGGPDRQCQPVGADHRQGRPARHDDHQGRDLRGRRGPGQTRPTGLFHHPRRARQPLHRRLWGH